MTKRNLTLLIIFLLIIALVVFGYLYFNKPKNEGAPSDTGTGTNFFSSLLNFGKPKTNTSPNGDGGETPADISDYVSPNPDVAMQTMRLVKISSMPVAGFATFEQERFQTVPDVIPPTLGEEQESSTSPEVPPTAPKTEFITLLRYISIASGNIFQTYTDIISERKFTETKIPIVGEAFFGDNGSVALLRYLKADNQTISTFAGILPKEVLGGDAVISDSVTGSFLPENITALSVSPDSSQIFYLFNSNDKALGTTALANGNSKTQVFSSSYTEWLSQWPNNNLITLTTKPSYNTPGYMYAINPLKKDFKKILSKINGLTTLTSPSGNLVLYSSNNVSLNIYNIDTGEVGNIPVKTLPEKCVWGDNSDVIYCAVPKFLNNNLQYPDSWYQGEVSFSDDIWRIDVASGTGSKILDPLLPEEGSTLPPNTESIDGVMLALDATESNLFFINKVDSYLWGLKIK